MSRLHIVCKICGARAIQAQLMEGVHISLSLCNLNKQVNNLRDELNYVEDVRDRLCAEIKEFDYLGIGEDIAPSRIWLKFALRSLKADIKSCSSLVTKLQQVKDGIALSQVDSMS